MNVDATWLDLAGASDRQSMAEALGGIVATAGTRGSASGFALEETEQTSRHETTSRELLEP